MCKVGFIVVFCSFFITLASAQRNCVGQGRIEGRVVDNEGRSLAGARVSVLAEECVVIGIAPAATTDDEGKFFLSGVPVGLNGVYAEKMEEGYPDTTAAIYVDDSAAPPKVVVRRDEAVSGVVIHLGKKTGVVFGEILDSESLQPVVAARIRISSPDNDRIMYSMGPDQSGHFRLLLPTRSVRLTINAPGYDLWEFNGNQKSPGIIKLDSQARTELRVRLRKLQR